MKEKAWPWTNNPVFISVVYYAEVFDSEHLHCCREIANDLKKLTGNDITGISRFHDRDPAKTRVARSFGKLPPVSKGQIETYECLVAESSRGRPLPEYPGCATRYAVTYGKARRYSRYPWQYAAWICADAVLEEHKKALSESVLRVSDLLSKRDGVVYGFVDLSFACESDGGRLYSLPGDGVISWDRAIEMYEWRNECPSKRLALGVFWSNYFGPTICKRLGSSIRSLDELGAIDPVRGCEPMVQRSARGGIRVTLSRNVMDTANPLIGPMPWVVARGAWLRRQLINAQLL